MRKLLAVMMAIAGMAVSAAAATITDVTAKQRFPWNGKVDITYMVTGDVLAARSSDAYVSLVVTVTNRVTGTSHVADLGCVSGDTGTAEGSHHVVWDLNAQGIEFKAEDVVFAVSYAEMPRYCVIDLSGGTDAANYPVSYMAVEPWGGFNTDEYKTSKLVLRLIEPGSFMMGGQYNVTLTKPFYCGIFEVTQKQYELVTGSNPSSYKGDTRPVEQVSWNMIRGNSSSYNWPSSANVDASTFIGRIQTRTGRIFDLPTEAQWEYACRAGTTNLYNNGGDTKEDLKRLGRYNGNNSDGNGGYSSNHTTVGSYQMNDWGLYDMHGNVWEWCLDWDGDLSNGVVDPQGPSSGTDRVLRGGSWNSNLGTCAASYRYALNPSYVYSSYGFRLVRPLSSTDGGQIPEVAAGTTLCVGDSAPVAIDSRVNAESVVGVVPWDASWIGGDTNATVVITDNGTEVKRATGTGEFNLSGIGRHELTYTTYIDGVAQDEVYTAVVQVQWLYEVRNGGSVITWTPLRIGSVTIPSEVGGYPVTGIASGAFKDCTGITGITMPSNVTEIGKGAFEGCTGITSACLPVPSVFGVSGFYEAEFKGLDSLDGTVSIVANARGVTDAAVMLSANTTDEYTMYAYGAYMYFAGGERYCFSAQYDDYSSVRVDETMVISPASGACQKRTGEIAFNESGWHWIELRGYNYGGAGALNYGSNEGFWWWTGNDSTKRRFSDPGDGSLFRVGTSCGVIAEIFPDSYDKIQTIELTGNADSVPARFFEGCSALRQIAIPSTVSSIEANAFDGCTSLASITIPSVVTNIGASAFVGCSSLTGVTIPDGVTHVGTAAFASCSNLTGVVIPRSVWSIGKGAFADCANLRRVEAPRGLKGTIEANDIFAGCPPDLEIVYVSAEITDVTAKQRWPWNGKVDITYAVTGDLAAGLSPDTEIAFSVMVTNRVAGTYYVASAAALSGDTGMAEGAHHVVWDLNAQGIELNSDDVVLMVAYATVPRYCVIDLSGGANAASYPVSYVADVPSGGWTDEYKTTKLVLRLIEPGTFMMGGSYQVMLTKPFYCGVFEVTQKQYELVTGSKPSSFQGDTLPVERVSWNAIRGDSSTYNWPSSANVDSSSFVGRLQSRTGLNLDLPTEAQWEYACRAGTTTMYYWGESMDGDYCWSKDNSSSTTHPVGTKTPNAWGLYDMSGNVWEWCLDWYGSLTNGMTDPEGSSSGSARVLRGGSWDYGADRCTSSGRSYRNPSSVYYYGGFRLVRTLSNE